MKHLGPAQNRGKSRLLLTVTLFVFALLLALVTDRLPGALDRSIPAPLQLACADNSNTSQHVSDSGEKAGNKVIVYVTSWCPACSMTISYLKRKNIPFVAKDVEKNEQYMKEMVKKVGGYRGVPVLDINGRILLGFNPQVLDQLAK